MWLVWKAPGKLDQALTIVSVLVIAERRKTVKVAQVTGFMERLKAWPIQVDEPGVHRAFQQILTTAREQNLSAYDAAYLELAMREGLPLATLDDDWKTAARAVGVKIVGAK